MPRRIASVVEGHGEREALPVLIRRFISAITPLPAVDAVRPIRIPRSTLLKPGELERAVQLAALSARPDGAVLVVLDADDDCPRTMAPELFERVRSVIGHLPVALVLAKCEFEAWFLAAADSLRGKRGLPADLAPPPDPEGVRGAKEWLASHMPRGQRYSETLDQPALAAVFDLDCARRRSASFDKFCRELGRLLGELARAPQQ